MFHDREICTLKVRLIHLRAAYFTYFILNTLKISYLVHNLENFYNIHGINCLNNGYSNGLYTNIRYASFLFFC
jgi:hypothetical protein